MPEKPKWVCTSIEPDGKGRHIVKMAADGEPSRTMQYTTANMFAGTSIKVGSLYHVNLVPAAEDIYA